MCAQHLVPLTALTGLTRLAMCYEQYDDGWDLYLGNRAPEGSPPDVWAEHCAADPKAQPAVISSMLQQLQQQRERGTQQEAQLQGHQEQARQQTAQLQKQQDDIAGLRQQHTQELAASKAEAAELRERVQALEGQQEQAAADRTEAAELRGRMQDLEGQLQAVLAALRQQQGRA